MILDEYVPEERSRFPVGAVLAGILFNALTTRTYGPFPWSPMSSYRCFARWKGVVMPKQPNKRTYGACRVVQVGDRDGRWHAYSRLDGRWRLRFRVTLAALYEQFETRAGLRLGSCKVYLARHLIGLTNIEGNYAIAF